MTNQPNSSFALCKVDSKENFNLFLIRKIKNKIKTVHEESIMTAITISRPLPGFTIANNIGFDIIAKMCALCDHLAMAPFRCESCFELYCERCSFLMLLVNRMKNDESTVGVKLYNINNIFCISSSCSKNTVIERLSTEQEYEQELLTVNCIYEKCLEKNFYRLMIRHVNECKHNSSKFRFDPAFIADTFVNTADPKLIQDKTMINYLSTIAGANHSETNRNIIAQDIYEQTFYNSFERQTAHLINLKQKIVNLSSEIELIKKSQSFTEHSSSTTNRRFSNSKVTACTRAASLYWGNWFANEEEKQNDIKGIEARKEERRQQEAIEYNLRREIRFKTKDQLMSHQQPAGVNKEYEPAFKKLKSTVFIPTFKPDVPEIDEQSLSMPSAPYRPDSTPGPTLKQSSDYANLMKRRWHIYQRKNAVERNQKTKERRNRVYEAIKAEFCSSQLKKIKPPQHFAWLIAKNNIKLDQDNLNACAIDIENLQLRVKVTDDQTEIIQVPCWISIVDSSGEIVLNEFVRHAKTAIHDLLTEHHSLTWDQLKNAPHFLQVRQKVITMLRKYKRIIVSGQVQDFKSLLITQTDHHYLLPRIICISSYYNCRLNSPQFGLKYCIFTLFGKITQQREHSALIDAAFTMYLYLIDYDKIERIHSDLLKTKPIRIHGSYHGYIYPKNYFVSGLLKDIMDYIKDWPLNLIKTVAMYNYMSRAKRERKIANSSYQIDDYVYPEPEPRPIPYKFTETKFASFRPRTY